MIFRKYLLIITVAALCLAATGNTACGAEKEVVKAEAIYRQAAGGILMPISSSWEAPPARICTGRISGKIALVEVDFEIIPWYTEATDQCRHRGAVAVVFFNKSYFGKPLNGEAFWVINLSGAKMHIPVLNTPVNDGRKLKEMILSAKSQAVQGTLISHIEGRSRIAEDVKGRLQKAVV